MDECPICLEPMMPDAIVGVVARCQHHYHEACLLQWSSHSNSCPTCRKHFHKINVVSDKGKGQVLRSFSVQDKIISTDAINNIPSEYIIPPNQVPQAEAEAIPDELDLSSGVCQICSSASYTLRSRRMVSCVACNAAFHVSCLGTASHQPGDLAWFCPVCDCYQEIHYPRSRRARATPTRVSRRTQGLITTDSDVVDDPFYQEFDEPLFTTTSRSSVMNGGVLLRREAQALRNLTPDEANLWSMFEQARSHDQDSSPLTNFTQQPEGQRRKRRRRRAHEGTSAHEGASEQAPVAENPPNGSSSSRIATLMNQIRLQPTRKDVLPSQHSTVVQRHTASRNHASPLLSPANSDSETESKRPCLDYNQELTLEQKKQVQKHVRDNLRPLYRPQSGPTSPGALPPSGPSENGIITSEHDYININKSISRKIYSFIVDAGKKEGRLALEGYFTEHSSQLRDLVDSCVQTELGK